MLAVGESVIWSVISSFTSTAHVPKPSFGFLFVKEGRSHVSLSTSMALAQEDGSSIARKTINLHKSLGYQHVGHYTVQRDPELDLTDTRNRITSSQSALDGHGVLMAVICGEAGIQLKAFKLLGSVSCIEEPILIVSSVSSKLVTSAFKTDCDSQSSKHALNLEPLDIIASTRAKLLDCIQSIDTELDGNQDQIALSLDRKWFNETNSRDRDMVYLIACLTSMNATLI